MCDLVSDETCSGCKYYGKLLAIGCKCCRYTYVTGKERKCDPGECTEKVIGPLAKVDPIRTGYLFKKEGR